jgi:hypothetical protein
LEVEATQPERDDAALHDREGHAQVDQRGDRHVAGNATEGIEKQDFARSKAGGQSGAVRLRRAL